MERPSLTSDDGDEDEENSKADDDDDDGDSDSSGDGGAAAMATVGPPPDHHGDLSLDEDVMRWRQRLVTSPPPRRAAHMPRRMSEDRDKEVISLGAGVTQSHSETSSIDSPKSLESLKHVSFDPFTLSLNAALEGELDVLQSLFSEVLLV